MTVNSTRDFIPPEPFEGQNYKPRYARPSASLREEQIRFSSRVFCAGRGVGARGIRGQNRAKGDVRPTL